MELGDLVVIGGEHYIVQKIRQEQSAGVRTAEITLWDPLTYQKSMDHHRAKMELVEKTTRVLDQTLEG